MSDAPTPETDRIRGQFRDCMTGFPAMRDLARRLECERDEARRELIEAGWTHEVGAPRWKPPVNHEIGKLWNRLFQTEGERDELRARVAELEGALLSCMELAEASCVDLENPDEWEQLTQSLAKKEANHG